MKNFISAEEVFQNLENFIIFDVRFDLGDKEYGLNEYNKSHIPQSFFIDIEKELSSPKGIHGGRHPLPLVQDFIRTMEKYGVSNDSKVVVYDELISSSPRLWWMLKAIGIKNVKILNGGFNNWRSLGFPVSDKTPDMSLLKQGNIEYPQKDYDNNVDIQFIQSILNHEVDNYQILDSRNSERYLGISDPVDKVPGRIPGAINVFFLNAYENGFVKSTDELKKLYKEVDVNKHLVVHCGSGVTAPANMAALEEIGIDSILYPGSFSDYVSYETSVIENRGK